MTTDAWGIADGYHDMAGVWRETAAETRAAIRAAMGADPGTEDSGPRTEEDVTSVRVLRRGRDLSPQPSVLSTSPAELTLEDGTVLRVDGALPPDLPCGYHDLRPLDGRATVRLIVSPGRCHLPAARRTWGWAVQLYALRSSQSWGLGDLADLRRLARWSAEDLGAGVLLVNPLHAAVPTLPQESSPYYPSSRRFRNPLYLRVEEVPGAGEARLDLESLASAGRALTRERPIDRDAVFRLKMEALERLWARFPGDPAFDRHCRAQGNALVQFATFCVLAELHRGRWQGWPAQHRRPDTPAVARLAAERADRVAFHAWLQWLLEEQMARAAAEIAVVQDLAIGVDPGGADAWAWQDVLALEVEVGAPPDEFNSQGQNWALPPFVPHKLRAAAYEPFIQTIRANLARGGGVRIDHVMGLFRLYWIPRSFDATHGAYVRYPAEDLLAIVALESQRAGAFVVGEDLGLVEQGVREAMAEHHMLSYRLLLFEPGPPEEYPELALAAVTTHDLPTLAGLWSGADVEAQRCLGRRPSEDSARALRGRVRELTGLPDDAPVDRVIEQTYGRLGKAPSRIVAATLDDALGVTERPNMPGTAAAERPNWSLALPHGLEALAAAPLPRRIGAALQRR